MMQHWENKNTKRELTCSSDWLDFLLWATTARLCHHLISTTTTRWMPALVTSLEISRWNRLLGRKSWRFLTTFLLVFLRLCLCFLIRFLACWDLAQTFGCCSGDDVCGTQCFILKYKRGFISVTKVCWYILFFLHSLHYILQVFIHDRQIY